MDFAVGMADMIMGMKAAQFSVQYDMSIQKMAMDTAVQAAQEMLQELPANVPEVPLGEFIDVYA